MGRTDPAVRGRPVVGSLLYAALTAVCVGAAYALVARRDLGAGLIAPRLGPPVGSVLLRSPFALAWRHHRATLLGWSIGMIAFGAFAGGAANGIDSLVSSSSQLEDIIAKMGGPGGLDHAYLPDLRHRRADRGRVRRPGRVADARRGGVRRLVRARHVGRPVAVDGRPPGDRRTRHRCAVPLCAGVGAGLAYGLAIHDVGGQLPRLIGATLVAWPAAAVLTGVAAALFGLLPRATSVAWGFLAAFALLGQLDPAPTESLGDGRVAVHACRSFPAAPWARVRRCLLWCRAPRSRF